eukprot:TRINITY_DN4237_c0_g1_i8.p1 TRINITY_DN4237_c0_g1~~TRINITY_DN4237_c0_g1_i8.p1  ORF type:complete len:115 (+),score=23.04 TRINITY_DN4237_c0_g1_i8:283-627(+)
MAINEPEEYKKMYKHLSPGAKYFLGDFLVEKLIREREKAEDSGPITSIYVHGKTSVLDKITLVENNIGQKPVKASLCTIFNQLENDGYQFVTCGGAMRQDETEMLFTFRRQTKN